MITLKWSMFPGSDVASYKIWRAIIGFQAPIVNLNGMALTLRINGGAPQTISFSSAPVVDTINAVLTSAQAYRSFDGLSFFVRSNIRTAPGSVEIVSSTAMAALGLVPMVITERSNGPLIATMVADQTPNIINVFQDQDGVLDDFYAVSTVSALAVESLKTPWQQPIQSAGPLCVVEGVLTDLQGVRIPDCEIIATLYQAPKNIGATNITKDPIVTISATDGRFSLPLLQGALVKLEIPKIGYSQMVTIPALSYVFMKDLQVDEDYVFETRQLGTM